MACRKGAQLRLRQPAYESHIQSKTLLEEISGRDSFRTFGAEPGGIRSGRTTGSTERSQTFSSLSQDDA
jgi:hypothetical protein